MVEMKVTYEGDLRTVAVHELSGTRLITDAPKDNQGQGLSFSPTDLVATALGTCMLTCMGIYARSHGIDLIGASARVQKDMVTSPVRRIGQLTVHIDVPGQVLPVHQDRLRLAAMTCPVHKSLHPDVKIPVEFHFGS